MWGGVGGIKLSARGCCWYVFLRDFASSPPLLSRTRRPAGSPCACRRRRGVFVPGLRRGPALLERAERRPFPQGEPLRRLLDLPEGGAAGPGAAARGRPGRGRAGVVRAG